MTRGFRTSIEIVLTDEQRDELESSQRSRLMPSGLARRGRIMLLLADGVPIAQIARTLDITRHPVYKWAYRFLEGGIDALADKPGRGRKPFFSPADSHLYREDGVRAA